MKLQHAHVGGKAILTGKSAHRCFCELYRLYMLKNAANILQHSHTLFKPIAIENMSAHACMACSSMTLRPRCFDSQPRRKLGALDCTGGVPAPMPQALLGLLDCTSGVPVPQILLGLVDCINGVPVPQCTPGLLGCASGVPVPQFLLGLVDCTRGVIPPPVLLPLLDCTPGLSTPQSLDGLLDCGTEGGSCP